MRISDWSSDVCSSDLAYGPGGMRARMGRHFRKSKAIRWHIDHLTQQAGMLQAALIEGGAACTIVRVLVATGEFRIPLKVFGSTDCSRCRSHLLQLRAGGDAGKQAGLFGMTSFESSVPGVESCPGRNRPSAMAGGGRLSPI